MTPRIRSAATLASLSVMVIGGGAVGWRALTAPLPEKEELPTCVATTARVGDVIFADQVTVSVYNGSRQNGLASRTLGDLVERGFHRGEGGNAPKKIRKGVQIWAADAKNPAVALVAGHFRDPKIVAGEALGPGVVVVVGDDSSLRPVRKSPESMAAQANGAICTPPGHDTLLDD
jgi:hypothetical protein